MRIPKCHFYKKKTDTDSVRQGSVPQHFVEPIQIPVRTQHLVEPIQIRVRAQHLPEPIQIRIRAQHLAEPIQIRIRTQHLADQYRSGSARNTQLSQYRSGSARDTKLNQYKDKIIFSNIIYCTVQPAVNNGNISVAVQQSITVYTQTISYTGKCFVVFESL